MRSSSAPAERLIVGAWALLRVVVFSVCVAAAFAQSADRFLVGFVLDPSDLPVPGAVVTLRGPGGDRSQAASISGEVRFDRLAPGRYRV